MEIDVIIEKAKLIKEADNSKYNEYNRYSCNLEKRIT